jgi:hypothetical protein
MYQTQIFWVLGTAFGIGFWVQLSVLGFGFGCFGFGFGFWVLLRSSNYDDYFYKKVALFASQAPQNTSS